MDTEIDKMIAEYIQFVKIIIEPETQIGQRAADFIALNSIKGLFNTRPIKRLQVYIFVINDIVIIIKYPSAFETVEVDYEENQK
jgi:hypothetical protein